MSNISDKAIFKRLYKYIKPHKSNFILALFLLVLSVFFEILGPYIQGRIVLELDKDIIDYSRIMIIMVFYFTAIMSSITFSYIQTMMLQKTGQEIMYQMREDVFTTLENLSIAQINSQPVGKLVTRVTSDTNTLNEFFTTVVISLIRNILVLIIVLGMMFYINVALSIIILCVTPFIVGVTILFRNKSRKAYRNVRTNVSNMNAFLSENLSGMKITQIFSQEEKKLKEFRKNNIELMKSNFKELLIFSIFRPLIYAVYIISCILVLYIGTTQIIGGSILGIKFVPGTLVLSGLIAFYAYINKFFDPIQQLAEQFTVLQSSFASSERIFEVLDTKAEILDTDDAIEVDELFGEIEFKNVWFAYNNENWILKDVTFKVNRNETVAFVGATGAGKTTILALIVRNYEIQKGQILIDGIDIKSIKIESLRKNIGQMLQDVFLFSGSILSNIQMRDETITLEEVKEACRYVNADQFIEKLEGNYDFIVKERGNNFSSGQRQLLSFARTIVHKPKIMILDEATSNIDTETEIIIQNSLEKMMNVGTMLIVAHRLSTVQHADKIIVLHKGQIVESGNHQELLHKKGLYYNLYEIQYKGTEE